MHYFSIANDSFSFNSGVSIILNCGYFISICLKIVIFADSMATSDGVSMKLTSASTALGLSGNDSVNTVVSMQIFNNTQYK